MEGPSKNKGKEIAISCGSVTSVSSCGSVSSSPHFEFKLNRVREMRLAIAALADPEFNPTGLGRIDVDKWDGFEVTAHNSETDTTGHLIIHSYRNENFRCHNSFEEGKIVNLLEIVAGLSVDDDECGLTVSYESGTNRLTFFISDVCEPSKKLKTPEDVYCGYYLKVVEDGVPVFNAGEGCSETDLSQSATTVRPGKTFHVSFLRNQPGIPMFPYTLNFCEGTAMSEDLSPVIDSFPDIVSCRIMYGMATVKVQSDEEYSKDKFNVTHMDINRPQRRHGWFQWMYGKMLETVSTLSTIFQVCLVQQPDKTIILRFPLIDHAGVLEFTGKAELIYPK